jgi:cob(I)alamin adenosyltransferase
MGNRLSKIVTRTGDEGTTGLGDGTRVAKNDLRIAVIGDIDELNSSLGVVLAESLPDDIRHALVEIQHDLFDLGGELCMPGQALLPEARVLALDEWIIGYNEQLAPLKEFVLPAGIRAAALMHVSRTVCRRAERSLVALGNAQALGPAPRHYVNRLSDLLFVLARVLNKVGGAGDVLWRNERT